MLKIGLTGSIAAGKSEAEKVLEDNFLVIDLDKVSHFLIENEARGEILAEFKTTDRKELAQIVFSDIERKKRLEEILYPKLKDYILKVFAKAQKPVVVSGALLYEAGFFPLFDKTVFIDAPYGLRLERLKKRNSLTEKEARRRMDLQSGRAKEFSDFVIENTGTIEELRKKVISFAERVL